MRPAFALLLAASCTLSARAADFGGRWETTYGPMTLSQDGARVSGSYVMGGRSCGIEGSLEGERLVFRYTEPTAAGEGWFEMLADGSGFRGRWRQDRTSAWHDWKGTRLQAGAASAPTGSFAGLWRTSFGMMRLSDSGGVVRGQYDYEGGSIEGSVAGRRLTFRYREGKVAGDGWFELSADGRSFEGQWKPDSGRSWNPWKGTFVAAERFSAPAPAAAPPVAVAPAVTKEDLRRMMQEVVAAEKPKEAPSPAVSDVAKPGYKKPEDPDALALVVGIEKYADLPEARHAERDAAAVRDHLLALGFPPRQVILLTGARATKSGLMKYAETWLAKNASERSTVVFYYSGHGAPDPKTGRSYLVPADGDPQFLEDTGYPVKRLYSKLSALKARRVLVALDACFSGAGGRSVLAKGARPLVAKTDAERPAAPKVLALAASEADQISGTIEDKGHGAFTYFLLKGLNGDAAGPDGSVTVQGLYDYLKPKVADAARLENRDQTPVLLADPAAAAFRLR